MWLDHDQFQTSFIRECLGQWRLAWWTKEILYRVSIMMHQYLLISQGKETKSTITQCCSEKCPLFPHAFPWFPMVLAAKAMYPQGGQGAMQCFGLRLAKHGQFLLHSFESMPERRSADREKLSISWHIVLHISVWSKGGNSFCDVQIGLIFFSSMIDEVCW